MRDFEKSFSEFIDQSVYDDAEEAIFNQVKASMYAIVREAYKVGWFAAGGIDPNIGDNRD